MPDRLHRHDTLVLAKALSTAGGGRLAVIDVQQRAIDATRERLADADADGWPELRVEYHLSDHSDWLEEIDEVRGRDGSSNSGARGTRRFRVYDARVRRAVPAW